MGTRADDLKSDLERQRRAVGDDLEAVGDRVSPGRMMERRRSAVRQRFAGARDRMTSVRNRVMGTAARARGGASGPVGSAGDTTTGTAQAVRDRVAEAPRAAESVRSTVGRATEGNPLAAGVIAFGAGLLAASLLPPTERERQVAERVKPALDEAREEATSAAREVADDLRPAAEDAAGQVRDRASGAAERVSGETNRAAQQVRSEATTAADEVRGSVRGERESDEPGTAH